LGLGGAGRLIVAVAMQSPLSVPAGVAATVCVAVAAALCVAEGDTWAVVVEEL